MVTRNGKTLITDGAFIESFAAIVGKKEGEGPLGREFDRVYSDTTLGQDSWERSESTLLKDTVNLCMSKAGASAQDYQLIFCGDLLDQCMGSSMAVKDFGVPVLGLYGACSTMAEALVMASVYTAGGAAERCIAAASSHFCSAERQFRFPLGYGGQRAPTSQWTVTGAGAAAVTCRKSSVTVKAVTPGTIVDMGVTDANNMGAAMAASAFDTLNAFFTDTGMSPEDFDIIATGDLGLVGSEMLRDMMSAEGKALSSSYTDCGILIFDREKQDVHAGGSGCGCGASVLCGYILPRVSDGRFKRALFAATGALMSPTSSQQGDSIPGICHAVWVEHV